MAPTPPPTINIPAGAVIHIHFDVTDISQVMNGIAAISGKQDQILAALASLQKETTMAQATLQDILNETARQTTIEKSTETFIAGLEAQILAANGNPTTIQSIFDALKGNNDAAAALIANTGAAPTAPTSPANPAPAAP